MEELCLCGVIWIVFCVFGWEIVSVGLSCCGIVCGCKKRFRVWVVGGGIFG